MKSFEIDHSEIISSQIAELCCSNKFSDVKFEIQDQKIPGHRVILASRSKYFQAMLFGGLAESKQEIIKVQAPLDAFKAILTYIYTGHLLQSQLCEEKIFDIFALANQYGFTQLELKIIEYFYTILSLDNAASICDTAKLLSLNKLQKVCYKFIDRNANEFLAHESFKTLSEEVLKDIIGRNTFGAPEFKIFTAATEWCRHNSKISSDSVMSLVRFPLISLEVLEVIQLSGIVDAKTVLDAIKQKTKMATSLPYRHIIQSLGKEENNIATVKCGARVIQGECGSALLDGNTIYFDLNKGFARHRITQDNHLNIIVELGQVTIINHIKLLLLDSDQRFYSYFVDVSVNKTQWERVVDHQSYKCRSWQFIYFPSKAVQYIKLVGTYGSDKPVFEVVSLEAYYTTKVPKKINGVLVPTKNVATAHLGALVINGSSGHHLLNGDINNYSLNSGYTYHGNGGSIIVWLGQPYVIGSMRLLLLDCDNRKFSFYIQTSINGKDWEIVVYKPRNTHSSWQNLVFKPRAMSFIKIIGKCTISKGTPVLNFQCVHFECPSQVLNINDDKITSSTKQLCIFLLDSFFGLLKIYNIYLSL